MAACFLECVDHIEYAVAFAGAEVVDIYVWLIVKFLECFYMTDCKVNYVDVIAHTGSVRSRVIIAEDTEAFQLADSNLCDIRNQVVRDSLRILADQTALVCTDWVEVAEQNDIPFRICHVQVS